MKPFVPLGTHDFCHVPPSLFEQEEMRDVNNNSYDRGIFFSFPINVFVYVEFSTSSNA